MPLQLQGIESIDYECTCFPGQQTALGKKDQRVQRVIMMQRSKEQQFRGTCAH
jgi:hypothetical protein